MATVAAIGTWVAANAGTIATVASVAGSVYSASKSSSAQADALERAGDIQGAVQLRQLALSERLEAEARPFREAQFGAALGAIPLLEEDVLREPGTGQPFKTALSRGTEALSSEFAKFGLVDSSVFRRDAGRFAEGLLSKDIENLRESRFRLAGFAPDQTGASISALSGASTTGGDVASLLAAQGRAKGGFFQSLGDISSLVGGLSQQGFFDNLGSSNIVSPNKGNIGDFSENFQRGRFVLN